MRKKPLRNEEVKLDPKKYIVSKTDKSGVIEYANDYFNEISGYEMSEIMGRAHSISRHPDMPKTIFKLIWDRLSLGQGVFGIVKNRTKDGRYYWAFSEFEIRKNNFGKIIGYTAYRRATSQKAIQEIEILYKKLLEIEDKKGIKGGYAYLNAYLEEHNTNYDAYIDKISGNNSVMRIFFRMMKKVFGDKRVNN